MGDHDGGYNPTEASHQALRGILRELDRHPIVTQVRGFPNGEFTRIVAQLDLKRWEIERGDATLTVRWFAGETPDARPEFSFHYSDESRDFGWHHEPNPHVDGWGHFQELNPAEDDYSYEPYAPPTDNPSRLVWEIMALLSSKLGTTQRYSNN